ncbi:MAG: CHAT domain-containing protein [Aromatoleum sp.]|nr:CHAT domain-containing protein [Aromatoleum sp.]
MPKATKTSFNAWTPARFLRVAGIGIALVCMPGQPWAQEGPAEPVPDVAPSPERQLDMTDDEARKVLATPVPADAPLKDRIDLSLRQRAAARLVGDQATAILALDRLVEIGKDRPEWASWMVELASSQFTFGSQQKSLEYGEKLLASTDLDPVLRANAAANLAWRYCEISDDRNCERVNTIAQRAYSDLPSTTPEGARNYALVLTLQAKAHVMKVRGDADARVAALREATVTSRNYLQKVSAEVGGDTRAALYRAAIVLANYTEGQFVYALVAQGRAAEALAVAQDGLARARLGNLGPDSLGGWHHRLAAAYVSQRRYDEALVSARASVAELRRAGGLSTGLLFALARNAEVVSLMGLERWEEADVTFGAFLEEIRADKVAYDRSYSAPLVALLAAKNSRLDVAMKVIDTSYRYRQKVYGLKHPLTVEARGVRGAIYLIANVPGSALPDYEDLFTALLDTSSGWVDLAPVGLRGQYLNVALTEFLKYAALRYQSGGPDAVDRRVFERLVQVTDRLGTGVAQRSILESTAKVRTGDPALSALLAQEQEQRGKLRDAYAQIFATVLATDARDTPEAKRKLLSEDLKKQREIADAAQKQLEAIRRELTSKFPEFLALVNPVNPNLDAIQKALTGGEAFIGIYPGREGTFVWAVNANGKRALHISRWTESDVAGRVAAMRAMLDVGDKLPRLPAMDLAPGLEIYNELLRPLRPALEGATVLNISAGGALGSLPLAALVTAPGNDLKTAAWLGRDFAIAQTPGAAAFVTLRQVESRALAARPFIGFGDPLFRLAPAAKVQASGKAATPATKPGVRNLVVTANAQQASTYSVENGFRYANIPSLPETRDELIALASALGADAKQDLLLGAAATRKAVLTTPLADRRVVAFATHGLLPGEIPGQSKPALAMAATDDPAESPLLTLDDVLSLKLNSQWVVLSACNTAGAERDGTAMSGLVRGFFFAGTRSVLATHWAVESDSARQLVSAIFSDYAKDTKGSRAGSLRRAQLAMIDGTLGNGSYVHPFYWAPYALFGDPTR